MFIISRMKEVESMNYKVVYLKEKVVAGILVRTSNNDSNMKKTIGEAWEKFFEDGIYKSISDKINENSIGLYTNYENEINGDYDVMVCTEILEESHISDNVELRRIEEGKYAKFVIKGDVKKAVGEFWTTLWKTNLDRKYSFDFEEYIGGSEMEDAEINIYISIN